MYKLLISCLLFCFACSRGGAGLPDSQPDDASRADPADLGRADRGLVPDLSLPVAWRDFKLVEVARFAVEDAPHSLITTDLNHDGRPDLVVGGLTNKKVVAYVNQGGLKFQTPAGGAVTTGFPLWLSTTARDHGGDIAVAGFIDDSIDLVHSDGTGALSGRIRLMTGKDHNPSHVAAADLDADGFTDLVSAEFGSGNSGTTAGLWWGKADGTFADPVAQPAGTGAAASVIADLNVDGIADIVTADYGGKSYSVVLGQGSRRFAAARTQLLAAPARIVQSADFNQDGKPDLAISLDKNPGIVAVLLGNGDGTFGPERDQTVGGGPYGLDIADLNHDGHPDIYTANYDGSSVSVLLGNGDGSFAAAVTLPIGKVSLAAVSADFDGDGKPDIAAVSLGTSEVVILRNESH